MKLVGHHPVCPHGIRAVLAEGEDGWITPLSPPTCRICPPDTQVALRFMVGGEAVGTHTAAQENEWCGATPGCCLVVKAGRQHEGACLPVSARFSPSGAWHALEEPASDRTLCGREEPAEVWGNVVATCKACLSAWKKSRGA